MRTSLFLFFLLGFVTSLSAQTLEQFIEDAEKQHQNENYYGAYDSYRIASQFDESRMDLWYQQAENARLYTAYETALQAYQRVLKSEQAGEFLELQLRLAQVNQSLGNYEESMAHYGQFLQQPNISNDDRILAEKGLKDSQWAIERMKSAEDIKVSPLPREINSEYADFGYHSADDYYYFSSNRVQYEEDEEVPARSLSRIFRVNANDTIAMPPIIPSTIKAGQHIAHTAFNLDRSRVYYTICDYIGSTEGVRCDIYFSNLNANGDWGTPVRLAINTEGYNNTQPHVAIDPVSGGEVLFFVSDRPGGQGGLDIYRSTLQADGAATTATNLSAINTAGDEISPFLDNEGCRLYFSTDGLPTLGGFDVYYVATQKDEFGPPVHLNSPVNSSFHDRYYRVQREEQKAYFSSNRQGEGAIHWSAEENACCDDIYTLPFDESVRLDVYTFRRLDKSQLNGATVKLYRREEDNSQVEIASLYQADTNHFTFDVSPGNDYYLEGTRPAFGPDNEQAKLAVSCEVADSQAIQRQLYLPQLLIVEVFDEATKEPLNNATVWLALNEEALSNPLFEETKPNTHHYEFLVSLERPYFIRAARSGYEAKQQAVTILASGIDEQGRYKVEIYLPKRDTFLLEPIYLYFDNDRPHPNSWRMDSDIEYGLTNRAYLNRQAAFIADLIKPDMSKEEAFKTLGALDDFFENDVDYRMEELNELAELLYDQLASTQVKYAMTLEGRASKRSNAPYNLNLSKRRVDSVIDYFIQYSNGKLETFINSGRLSFIRTYAGDQKADPADQSVFGLRASRDRVVVITEIKEIE